jgi:hypothetical protein
MIHAARSTYLGRLSTAEFHAVERVLGDLNIPDKDIR